MAQKPKEIAKRIERIFNEITEGKSVRKALKNEKMSSSCFYKYVIEDDEKAKQFAHACDIRQRILLDECIDISDEDGDDEKPFVGINHVHRDKLKIQTRLDVLARMNPKKYGNKIDVTSKDEAIKAVQITGMIINNTDKSNEDDEEEN